jgi:serine/threonine protein phosphatase PrpC
MSVLLSYGMSQTGLVRAENQDAIRSYEPEDEQTLQSHGQLYAVADGLGGYEHGGIASTLALETFFSNFYSGSPHKSPQNLRQGFQAANLAVAQTAQRMQARMGTTLSAINIIGDQLHIAHIGDSRVYLVRNGKALCLTNDHTAVGEMVRMRVLSPDKVRTHERRSVLEKCLGIELFVQPDISRHIIQQDDFLILCTDGVWAYVEDNEFADITLDRRSPEQIGQTLVESALARDSDDNVSALVIHVAQLVSSGATHENNRFSFTQFILGRLTGKTS